MAQNSYRIEFSVGLRSWIEELIDYFAAQNKAAQVEGCVGVCGRKESVPLPWE